MTLINSTNDPWHFSHLGQHYFLRIMNILGFKTLVDTPIEILFLGKTGEPYIKKRKGRQVNPNWCVKMKDGSELRFGTPTGNIIQSGLWNLSNCNVYNWIDITNYFTVHYK